jgi:hypothetical protein
MHSLRLRWISIATLILSSAGLNHGAVGRESDGPLATSPSSGVIVIGFVGGFIRSNDAVHQEVQLAAHLRRYSSGTKVIVFANHQGKHARDTVLQLLDRDHNGTLSDEEKCAARIVLYGHSWGASEAIALARMLGRDGISVLLTIQVDSVSKWGEDDRLIPVNVAQAINFFQADGFLHGRREILAVDRSRTQILGNVQVGYKTKSIKCTGYPWYAQIFMKPHIEIESDPVVWNRIESLILSKLPPASLSGAMNR